MLMNLEEFISGSDSASRFDVCIAGAGPAGISLALELANRDKRVLLLEGGDIDFSESSQELYHGKLVGRDYFPLDISRLRFLGGTSNHWAGYCLPLDDFDFEARSDIAAYGWPITKADIVPWLEPAAEILQIDSNFPPYKELKHSGGKLRHLTTHFSPPVRFGEKYSEKLRSNPNIWAVINASITDIGIDPVTGQVQHFKTVHTNDPNQKAEVIADRFVLALGGIENARVLLNSNSQRPYGIGNDNDLVGRYFMEHIEVDVGFAILRAPISSLFNDVMVNERDGEAVSFSITQKLARSAGILNCELRLEAFEGGGAQYSQSLKARVKSVVCNSNTLTNIFSLVDEDFKQQKCRLQHRKFKMPDEAFDGVLKIRSEQAPNPNSRVLLANERDRLGMRRVALDWQLTKLDKETIKRSILELGRYFADADLGRIRAAPWTLDDGQKIAGMADGERGAGFHHMGTTRMASSAKRGVVDSNCRVFGTKNLYIAGSSVFATGGNAPPTLTIVQLSLRLAEHLAVQV